ncbi:hypothetical protein D3C85_1688960 [compost metagenome]
MVHHHQVHLLAQHGPAKIGDRHFGGGGAALAGHVGVDAAHVENQAQTDHIVGDGGRLREGGGRGSDGRGGEQLGKRAAALQ